MKCIGRTIAATIVFLPIAAAPAFSQEAASYVGELTGGCSSDRGRPLEIEIKGTKVTGVMTRTDQKLRFSGELKGSSFQTATRNQTPFTIRGTVAGDTIQATVGRDDCNYRATLKKK